ncbi:hypothetical protein [Limosilactobacillus mucosae]|uniref:hypothetical protein n=1 Tax=Limosilactobacillus mucosae TaxID=97478 RepID=UPI000889CF8C|nr:hypothetical protein [Limosilactobacillus mucosae]SDN82216.1 hypothetical protein SAMN05216430_11912 [Limosilactobacillus mucosae]SEL31353.1 hypothetical protein SAMN05216545_11612 [Limosilactobacillus mucosae]SFK39319.1 hypothetical protein SAMN05216461_1195 [Limosilactobacillus mucosae]
MNNWQTFYSASEQAIILAKHQRGIGFPAELYQRALKAGKSIPHYQRIVACQQAQLPLLSEDIQNLTAVINHQPLSNPVSGSAKQHQRAKSKKQQPMITRPHEKNWSKMHTKSKKQRPATNNANPDAKTSAKKQLQTMLKRYDGLVASAEEIGVMQFEKHRRYRNRAFEVLNDPDATMAMAAMHRQANYLEGQIKRLEERMQQRMF